MLAVLARADVDFIVVGGMAVAQAGYARFTEVIDVLVDASPANLERLIATLSTMGDGAAAELAPEDFPLEEGAVRVIEDVIFDIFTQMSGHTYADLEAESVVHGIEGEPVQFLSAEGLIRLKSDSLRPKDQLDIVALRAVLEGRDPNA